MEDIININEYVRIKDGRIYQLEDLEDPIFLSDKFYNKIVKHSPNIIDLIQVSDYVNGYRVTDKYFFAGEVLVLETEGEDTNCKCLCNEDIKDVVTKEQFNQMKYIVGYESNVCN